jgi:hypothetical protein
MKKYSYCNLSIYYNKGVYIFCHFDDYYYHVFTLISIDFHFFLFAVIQQQKLIDKLNKHLMMLELPQQQTEHYQPTCKLYFTMPKIVDTITIDNVFLIPL